MKQTCFCQFGVQRRDFLYGNNFKNITYKAGVAIAGGIGNQKESTCNVRDTGDAGSIHLGQWVRCESQSSLEEVFLPEESVTQEPDRQSPEGCQRVGHDWKRLSIQVGLRDKRKPLDHRIWSPVLTTM